MSPLNISLSLAPSLSYPPRAAAGNGTTAAPDPVRDCCGLEGQEAGVGWLGAEVYSEGQQSKEDGVGVRLEVGSGVYFEAVGLSALVGN